ncbi:MAG: hypothetical protein Q4G59_09050, partial [Planctomycetia bacterium]|nr:hypothetical protein [Planctomycetia bacterium]
KAAIATAKTTTTDDLIVLRTTNSANTITYTDATDEIMIQDIAQGTYGKLTIVGFGTQALTINANQVCRVMSITTELGEADPFEWEHNDWELCNYVQLGNLTISGGKMITEHYASGGGIDLQQSSLAMVNCTVTDNIVEHTDSGSNSQTSIVPELPNGATNVYLLVCGDVVPQACSYTLNPFWNTFYLNAAVQSPESNLLMQDLVLDLNGYWESNLSQVELIDSNGTPFSSTGLLTLSKTDARAYFNTDGMASGLYSVKLTAGGETKIFDNFYEKNTEEKIDWTAYISVDSSLMTSSFSVFYVVCKNTGNVAIEAPVFTVNTTWGGNNGAFLTTDIDDVIRFYSDFNGRDYSKLPEGFTHQLEVSLPGTYNEYILPGQTSYVACYYAGWQTGLISTDRNLPVVFSMTQAADSGEQILISEGLARMVTSLDPNEIVGPSGIGEQAYMVQTNHSDTESILKMTLRPWLRLNVSKLLNNSILISTGQLSASSVLDSRII